MVSTLLLGSKVQISAYTVKDLPNSLQKGLDVAALAEEGLVDSTTINPWYGDMDVASFVRVTRGAGCQVCADILGRRLLAQEHGRRALDFHATGVEGLTF